MHPLERHWQRITPISVALLPLTALFAVVSWLRRLAYATGILRTVRVPVPVVVVGNLSVGGTGKTPVVIWLINALRAQGFTPGVISRGYRGSEQLQAIDRQSPANVAGDEPALIARRTCLLPSTSMCWGSTLLLSRFRMILRQSAFLWMWPVAI